MERKISAVMYGKFKAKDNRMALLKKDKKGVEVIDKPFKKVLQETIENNNNNTIQEEPKKENDNRDNEYIWTNIFPQRRW